MIVAFQRNHQQLVDTWFDAGDTLEKKYNKPGKMFRYYEIPTIYKNGIYSQISPKHRHAHWRQSSNCEGAHFYYLHRQSPI